MTHAYFHAESAAAALARMLPPILKAGGSTLLAVLPMAFSQSYVIRLFFAMSLMIISLGLFVGLLVVPAALQTADDDEPGGDDTRRASRLRVMELCDTGG